jgi:hypothetical protein
MVIMIEEIPPSLSEFETARQMDAVHDAVKRTSEKRHPALFPVVVERDAREILFAQFPNLRDHPKSREYRSIAEYLFFSSHRDDEGHVITPHAVIAERVGKSVGSKGFAAGKCLDEFSQEVWTLQTTGYDRFNGLARTVITDWPGPVSTFLDKVPLTRTGTEMVFFVSGEPVSKSRRRRIIGEMEYRLLADATESAKGKPVQALIGYLNSHSQTVQRSFVRRNWHKVENLYRGLPVSGSNKEEEDYFRRRKQYVASAMTPLFQFGQNIYEAKERTSRIYTVGPSYHSLPRPFRKALLDGTIGLDARAIQLAIVSRLWQLPKMQAFLSDDRSPSIWKELYCHLDASHLDFDETKAILKTTLYRLVYGMDLWGLRWTLQWGDKAKNVAGLRSNTLVDRFFKHPLIEELIIQRDAHLADIKHRGFIVDRFAQRRDIAVGSSDEKSLLATEVQSWEMYLMLPLLEVFEQEAHLHVVSFLHDGIAVHVSDPKKEERIVKKLTETFRQRAYDEEIATRLDREH